MKKFNNLKKLILNKDLYFKKYSYKNNYKLKKENIKNLINNKSAIIRAKAIISSLKILNKSEITKILRKKLKTEKDKLVLSHIIYTLSYLNDTKSLNEIYNFIHSKSLSLKIITIIGLSRLESEESFVKLLDLIKEENNPTLRYIIAMSLTYYIKNTNNKKILTYYNLILKHYIETYNIIELTHPLIYTGKMQALIYLFNIFEHIEITYNNKKIKKITKLINKNNKYILKLKNKKLEINTIISLYKSGYIKLAKEKTLPLSLQSKELTLKNLFTLKIEYIENFFIYRKLFYYLTYSEDILKDLSKEIIYNSILYTDETELKELEKIIKELYPYIFINNINFDKSITLVNGFYMYHNFCKYFKLESKLKFLPFLYYNNILDINKLTNYYRNIKDQINKTFLNFFIKYLISETTELNEIKTANYIYDSFILALTIDIYIKLNYYNFN